MLSESPSMEQTPQFPSIEQKNSEIYQSYTFVTNKLRQKFGFSKCFTPNRGEGQFQSQLLKS